MPKENLWESLQEDVVEGHKAVFLGMFSSKEHNDGHAIAALPLEFLGKKGKKIVEGKTVPATALPPWHLCIFPLPHAHV